MAEREKLLEAERKRQQSKGGISYDEWYSQNKHKKLKSLKDSYGSPAREDYGYGGTLSFEAWEKAKLAQMQLEKERGQSL